MDLAKHLSELIITPEFLMSVERWSRYTGEHLSIGDADVHIEDKGVLIQRSMSPKMVWDSNHKMSIDGEEEDLTYYDVSILSDSPTCAENSTFALISKRPNTYIDDDGIEKALGLHNERMVYIYSIKFDNETNDHECIPTWDEFKKSFEAKEYTHYNSLLYEFCGTYSLQRYNELSDRFMDYNLISNDLFWLDTDEETKEISLNLKVGDRKLNTNLVGLDRKIKEFKILVAEMEAFKISETKFEAERDEQLNSIKNNLK